jgi:hypothetical protein
MADDANADMKSLVELTESLRQQLQQAENRKIELTAEVDKYRALYDESQTSFQELYLKYNEVRILGSPYITKSIIRSLCGS